MRERVIFSDGSVDKWEEFEINTKIGKKIDETELSDEDA